jgi:hypothetical protein
MSYDLGVLNLGSEKKSRKWAYIAAAVVVIIVVVAVWRFVL